MTDDPLPHVKIEQVYLATLYKAQADGSEEFTVNIWQWHAILQCAPSRDLHRDPFDNMVTLYDQRYRLKTRKDLKPGVVDLSGETSLFDA